MRPLFHISRTAPLRAGYPLSSRVIYTAKGGHSNPADAPPATAPNTASSNRPPALRFTLTSPHEAPWLDSAGGGGGGPRGRAYSANSAAAAGLQSPRYLQSTTVSQAKAVEPGQAARAAGRAWAQRSRSRRASSGWGGGAPSGAESDGVAERCGAGGGWGAGGLMESLGGFLGIGRGGSEGAGGGGDAEARKEMKRGRSRRESRSSSGQKVRVFICW